ncbi:MAG: CHAT domain-containing tetratricopeptide repeat protein [Chitinophagaceae bacterium]
MLRYLLIPVFLFSGLVSRSQNIKELSDSLLYYYQQKNYTKAIPVAEQAVDLVKTKYGTNSKIYSTYLSLLSGIYFANSDMTKAETSLLELQQVNKTLYGTQHEEYIKGISLLAVVYNVTGKNERTIPLLTEAMEYYKQAYGDSSYEYASSINKLAKVYGETGQYEKAAPLSRQALALTGKVKGTGSIEYATILNNLGLLSESMGYPEQAEPLMLRAMEIRKKLVGEKDPDYANSLNNLAALYAKLGQTEKATGYYQKAAAIYKETDGETGVRYLTILTNIGVAYEEAGDYTRSEKTYLDALAIARKKYNDDWPLIQNILASLGQLYISMENYKKAEPLIRNTVETERRINDKSDRYAASLNDLAYLYNNTNRRQEAESLYIRASELMKAAVGEAHYRYAAALDNLAFLYMEEARYAESIQLMKKVTGLELDNFLKLFSVLSESEKMTYLNRNFFLQYTNLSLLYRYPAAPASAYTDIFNMQLFMKSALLTDSRNVLETVEAMKDTAVIKLLDKWKANKKWLAAEYALPEASRSKDLVAMEAETEDTEKELVRLSAAFRNMRKGLDIKMPDVQNNLDPDEAAVEFVSFRLTGREVTDSTLYGAFIVRKQDARPVFVPLFEEKQISKIFNSAGKTSDAMVKNIYRGGETKSKTTGPPSGRELYKLIWAPLEPWLNGIRKISYSPAGKLYNIALQALPVDSTTLLMDKYRLTQYTSTRQVALRKTEGPTKTTGIVLFGDAAFDMDSAAIAGSTARIKEEAPLYRPGPSVPPGRGGRGGVWNPLPGTAEEVKRVKSLFEAEQLPAVSFTQTAATEEALKSLSGKAPEVLHIATHGFFLPGPDKAKQAAGPNKENAYKLAGDPLLRSGLILAGGNYAWSGKIPVTGAEDGIVTAYEISQLDLSQTKLVVLSACETALGDIKGSEGVFGLQRSFKMAGVKKMIVSLWQVPDKETAELMTTFYSYLLKGQATEEAFAQAQADMRKKYAPYFWAAFILVE